MAISNTLAAYGVDWDYAEHLAHGFEGGTDYKVPRGAAVRSPSAGRFLFLSTSSCGVMVDDELTIVLLELGGVRRLSGRIPAGTILGTAGAKWVHIHGLRNGRRVPFESLVAGSANSDKPVPIPTPVPEAKEITVRVVRSIKDDVLPANTWPQGVYLVTENGVTAAASSNLATVNRLLGLPAPTAPLEFYSSELRDLDQRLRAARTTG